MLLTGIQRNVVVALAESNMNISLAAKKLNKHNNTITYYITSIKEATNLDPRNFFDLFELLQIAGATNYEEVVRCKDCIDVKHCLVAQVLGDNGFCSYGDTDVSDSEKTI